PCSVLHFPLPRAYYLSLVSSPFLDPPPSSLSSLSLHDALPISPVKMRRHETAFESGIPLDQFKWGGISGIADIFSHHIFHRNIRRRVQVVPRFFFCLKGRRPVIPLWGKTVKAVDTHRDNHQRKHKKRLQPDISFLSVHPE